MQVHAYTVCMVTAVVVGGWLTYREAQRRMRLTEETLAVVSIGLLSGILGACPRIRSWRRKTPRNSLFYSNLDFVVE